MTEDRIIDSDEMADLAKVIGHPDDYADEETFPAGEGLTPLTPGQMVKALREIDQMTQIDLAEASGIPQATISGIELGRITLGLERIKVLAVALKVHPSVIAFSDWRRGDGADAA